MIFAADFETTNDRKTNHVWSWEALEVGDTDHPFRGTSIDDFIDWCMMCDKLIYFHNVKFDSSYIISEIFKRGYIWHSDRKKLHQGMFTTLMADTGIMYSVEIVWENGIKTTLYDSYKLISLSVEDIAVAYNLPCRKLEIDYNLDRPVGYQPTEHEWAYQHNDVVIMSLALDILFKQNMRKMTQSSNAMEAYKNMIGKKQFKYWFPITSLEDDEFGRKSYNGGSVQVGEKYQGIDVGYGIVLDVNSMYPWAMRYCWLPYGKPVWYDGKYESDKDYPLYIQEINVSFHVKQGMLPTIQAKRVSRFRNAKFISSTDGRVIPLVLTSVDLEMMMKHYDIDYIEYVKGMKFAASKSLFAQFIDHWNSVKEKATEDGDYALRQIAKDMMNKLSGKFGLKPKVCSKEPYYDHHLRWRMGEEEERKPIYVHVVSFITAYGRQRIIDGAQHNIERFCYMDTDSLHLEGMDLPEGLDIDSHRLGAFKIESSFSRARFLHTKCYLEETLTTEKEMTKLIETGKKKSEDFYVNRNGELVYMKVTTAGLPAKLHSQVTFDNFYKGTTYDGKLRPLMTPNGIILEETTFTISS